MHKKGQGNVVVAVDIGTTKICVIVAQLIGDAIVVLGIGKTVSDGLEKGIVVDIPRTVASISRGIQEAELMADITIEEVYIGISGSHINSFNTHGAVAIRRGRVTSQDITNVMDAARAIPVAQGYQMLHVLAQYFVIDGRERINDPQGMHGTRLEVEAHIILGAVTAVQNLIKCCELAGVRVKDVVLEQIASAHAVLSSDEQQLGCGVIDIGGGTSDFALYKDGNIRHSFVLPVAGNHVTRDLAIGLCTTIQDAERVKREYGKAAACMLSEDIPLEVMRMHGGAQHIVLASEVVAIIEPRIYELLSLIHANLLSHKLMAYMSGGLVITGGGALLPGIDIVASTIFGIGTRIGYPNMCYQVPPSLNSPVYATGYGLLVHALQQHHDTSQGMITWTHRLTHRMRSWIADFF